MFCLIQTVLCWKHISQQSVVLLCDIYTEQRENWMISQISVNNNNEALL